MLRKETESGLLEADRMAFVTQIREQWFGIELVGNVSFLPQGRMLKEPPFKSASNGNVCFAVFLVGVLIVSECP